MDSYFREDYLGNQCVKFDRGNIRNYLSQTLMDLLDKRSNEPDVEKALAICDQIEVVQIIYEDIFGDRYPI